MTGLVARVRGALDPRCIVQSGLSKEGCKVSLAEVPAPRLTVDFDRPGSPLAADEVRCDYLLIAEGEQAHSWVAVLELKRGKLHADQVVRQLRAGASAAERLVSQNEAFRFRPIAASGSRPKFERAKLREAKNMIGFHGRMEFVRLMSCGDKLVTVLHP